MEPLPSDDDLGIDVAAIIAEEAEAARRREIIEAGRRRAGVTGAAMAGIMLVISDIYEAPERDEIVAVADAPGDPVDIDADGIAMDIDGLDLWTPPADDGDA